MGVGLVAHDRRHPGGLGGEVDVAPAVADQLLGELGQQVGLDRQRELGVGAPDQVGPEAVVGAVEAHAAGGAEQRRVAPGPHDVDPAALGAARHPAAAALPDVVLDHVVGQRALARRAGVELEARHGVVERGVDGGPVGEERERHQVGGAVAGTDELHLPLGRRRPLGRRHAGVERVGHEGPQCFHRRRRRRRRRGGGAAGAEPVDAAVGVHGADDEQATTAVTTTNTPATIQGVRERGRSASGSSHSTSITRGPGPRWSRGHERPIGEIAAGGAASITVGAAGAAASPIRGHRRWGRRRRRRRPAVAHRGQRLGQLAARGVAVGGIDGHGGGQHPVEGGEQVGTVAGDGRSVGVQVLVADVQVGPPGERHPAGEALEGGAAE